MNSAVSLPVTDVASGEEEPLAALAQIASALETARGWQRWWLKVLAARVLFETGSIYEAYTLSLQAVDHLKRYGKFGLASIAEIEMSLYKMML